MPEKDYRDRDIVDKLGIKPGHAVVFAHEAGAINSNLCQRIMERTGRAPASEDEVADVVLAAIDETSDAVAVLKKWRAHLVPNGGIWLLTVRRGQPGYVDQRELIEAGQRAEVVDNKICSVSPAVSAMRFVVRKKDRTVCNCQD